MNAEDEYMHAVQAQADADELDDGLPDDPVTQDWVEAWGYSNAS